MNPTPNGMTVSNSLSPAPSQSGASMNNGGLTAGVSGSPMAAISANSSPGASRTPQPEQIIVPVGNVMNTPGPRQVPSTPSNSSPASASSSLTSQTPTPVGQSSGVLDRQRLRELVKEVDPMEQMDDDVEDVLLQVADDFIENVVASSCQLAKHRRSNTLEAKDVQLYLERCWNMQIPGFGAEETRPYKKAVTTEAHKQRMALIRKTLKKY